MTNYIEDSDNDGPIILTVPREAHGTRLDQFLSDSLQDQAVSRERLKRAIKDGNVQVDAARCTKPNTRVVSGMQIEVLMDFAPNALVPEDAPLHILYRDEHIAVLNKQPDLTVHPCPSCPSGTLVHRLLHHFPELARMEGPRPGIVHRLDKDTSGIIVVALTEEARLALSQAFAEHDMIKEYLALTVGVPELDAGIIEAPIGRHPTMKVKMAVVGPEHGGRAAVSEFRVLHADREANYALVAVRIHTGRTHQIRVHMSHMGYPLWGDTTYGGGVPAHSPIAAHASRQMLHAWRLQFAHPVTGAPLSFSCPPPDDFTTLVAALSARTQRVVITGMPGCGKSALLKTLGDRGMPIWTADGIVHALYAEGGDGWHFLRGRYGDRFAPADGPVNRAALFAAMQESVSIRREVEACIHPIVRHDLLAFWQEHTNVPVAVAEVPLILEAGWREDADILVGVHCPREIRARRVEENRGWAPEVLASMEAWQWPEDDKMAACDIVVDNSGSLETLRVNADKLLASLMRRREDRLNATVQKLHGLWDVA